MTTVADAVNQASRQETTSHVPSHAPSHVFEKPQGAKKRKKSLWSRVKKKFRKQQHHSAAASHNNMEDEHIRHEPFEEWEVWGEDGKYEERRITWPKPDTQQPTTSYFTEPPSCDQYDVTSVCSDSSDVISMNTTTYDVTADNTNHDDTECSDKKSRTRKKGLMRRLCKGVRKFFRGGQTKQTPSNLTKWGAVNDLSAGHSPENLTHWGGIVNLAADTDF